MSLSSNVSKFLVISSQIRKEDDKIRVTPYSQTESISQTKSNDIAFDKTYEICDEWLVPEERQDINVEDSREGRANRNRLIERIFIVTVVKNSFTRLVMSPEFVAGLFTSTETQQTDHHSESFMPTLQRSGSLTVASTDNLTSLTQTTNVYAQALDGQPSSELQIVKVLAKRHLDLKWPASKLAGKSTLNVSTIAGRLHKAMPQPTGDYLRQIAEINNEVAALADVQVFKLVTERIAALGGRNERHGEKFKNELRDVQAFTYVEYVLRNVQERFGGLKKVVLKATSAKNEAATRQKLNGLCRAVNSTIEWRLNEMLVNSSIQIRNLVRYLLQGFDVGSSQQAKFDRLLPRTLYILKCEGMEMYCRHPDWMTSAFHPRALYCHSFSPFMRRVHLARYYARYFMETVSKGNF